LLDSLLKREEMSLGHGVLSDYLQESGSFSFAQDSSREIKLGGEVPRLPLFSRCPITNQARLEDPREFLDRKVQRIPLNSLSNVAFDLNGTRGFSGLLPGSRGQCGSAPPAWGYSVDLDNSAARNGRSSVHKPSLDEVRDNSVVALTNKFGKGKYWFKSASPTPDPRWAADQQLMIGPIPGDVEYSQLRAAFLAQGHTLHLFIQNNQGWLEKNQEKFGAKHVKFGYVVYTEKDTARRLLCAGFVPVGSVKIRVKEMDGQPAIFM